MILNYPFFPRNRPRRSRPTWWETPCALCKEKTSCALKALQAQPGTRLLMPQAMSPGRPAPAGHSPGPSESSATKENETAAWEGPALSTAAGTPAPCYS